MTKAEFDTFAKNFAEIAGQNTSFFGADYGYFGRYRSNIVKKLSGPDVADILDFGCGVGLGMSALRVIFPKSRIVGCDPSQESLAVARTREPDCEFLEPRAIGAIGQFDVITAVSVFHHIAPAGRNGAFKYCYERLRPGGRLFVFEHNPYNPLTRHLVSRCTLDRNAILLPLSETLLSFRQAGFDRVAAAYCLFFPKALGFLRPLENSLGWLPLGGQYYVCGRRP